MNVSLLGKLNRGDFPGLLQLRCEIDRVPERRAIDILAANKAGQAFDGWMRNLGVRSPLDFLDLENAQAGESTG